MMNTEETPKGWKKVKLREVGNIVTGKTPSSKNPGDWGSTMPFITPSDYKNYRKYAITSKRYLSNAGISKLRNKVLPINSIMVTCIGSDMGKVVMNKIPVITNQQINSIIPNQKIIDNNFLFYNLIFLYDVLRMYGGSGTAVPIVNKTDFENIETEIPPLPEQKAIAAVLSSLDDKIELLHRENETLEQMAEALFRKWFIEDAKEDWEEVKLGDLVDLVGGYNHKKEQLTDRGGILLSMGSVVKQFGFSIKASRHIKVENIDEKYFCKYGDIFITTRDVTQNAELLGSPGIIPSYFDRTPIILGSNLYKLIIKDKMINKTFLYELLKSTMYRDYVRSSASGTSVLMFKKSDLVNFKFKKPDKYFFEKRIYIISDLHQKLDKNYSQIRTLENLRDTLLPKLMSGKVRVKF